MRPYIIALLTLLVAFSGCFGGDDDGDDTTTGTQTGTTTATGTGTTTTGTSTGEPEPEENTPPTASISASIEQGQIPFNVTFTLDGADADGDALSWTLDADGDDATDAEGTELPADYNHTYESEGLFNVTFTVSDGTDESVQTLVINATAAAQSMAPDQSYAGSLMAANPLACAEASGGPGGGGILYDSTGVDSGTVGGRFTATFEPTDASAVANVQVVFRDDDANHLAYYMSEELSFSDKIPQGSTVVFFQVCATAGGNPGETAFTYDAFAP